MTSLLLLIVLFTVTCSLTVRVRKTKQNLDRKDKRKNVRYYFLKNTYDFLLPLTFVLGLYLVLAVVTRALVRSDSTSLGILIKFEHALATIRNYSYFRLSALQVLLCYVVLYLLGVFPFILVRRQRIYDWLEKYYLPWSKRVYIVLVLLCSLTLLGTQVGRPGTDFQLRIKTIRDGYAQLQNQTRELLSQEVALHIYDKVHDTLPPSYGKALTQPKEIKDQLAELRNLYDQSQREYGSRVESAESLLSEYSQRRERAETLETNFRFQNDSTGDEIRVAEPEPKISYRQIKEAESALETFKQGRPGTAITFFESQEGKRIVLQVEKVFSSKVTKRMFEPVFQMWPYSEPIIDVFISTLNDKLKAMTEKSLDNLTNRIVQNPASVSNMLKDEATNIVGESEIDIPTQMAAKAAHASKDLDQELASLQAAKLDIEKGAQLAKDLQAEKPITQLQSSDESMREGAVLRLLQLGDQLSEAKVNKLINIMRNGSKTWSSSEREVGHHCTWYTYTPIRYYAAKALANMKSKYVSDELAREARSCESNSITRKRVTDPGWI